jgi:peptidoglycan/xylan/chitin deacetylase (PgdA/CDA1 family)
MRKRILIFIAGCFYYSGLINLARWWTSRLGKRLVILNYHRAAGGNLHRHLLYLRRHYRILHLDEALEELYRPCTNRSHSMDHRIPLVLTLDDGYHDNYTYGFALARDLQIPFTIFLIPGYVEKGTRFWWLEAKHLVCCAQVNEAKIEGRSYHLYRQEEREALARMIDTRLRCATSVDERETFLASIYETLKVPSSLKVEEQPMLSLTWAEVQEMKESGWVSYGAHTMNHPILSNLSDPAEIQREVNECRKILEQRLNQPVCAFAYPVGKFQHAMHDILQAVHDAGYNWACTTRYGFNSPQSDPYLLRRISVDANQHWLVVAAEAAGLWGLFSWLREIPAIHRFLVKPLQ